VNKKYNQEGTMFVDTLIIFNYSYMFQGQGRTKGGAAELQLPTKSPKTKI
jgi:hypothetical protein